jgi:hypothetical protein
MKTVLLLLWGLIVFAGDAGRGLAADVEVPPGIVYKPVDAATDAKARQAITEAFSAGAPQVFALLTDPVICGAAYWSAIKGDPAIHAAATIPSHFKFPAGPTGQVQTMEGATFKEAAARQVLAGRLAADVGKDPALRKLRPDELRVYWAMIPFDIEEPLYILEVGKKRFLLNLQRHEEQFSVMWVDEISAYKFGK